MADPSLEIQYDLLYMLRPDLPQEEQDQAIKDYQEIVAANGGTVLAVSEWGRKRLAYEIDGYQEGIYVNMPIEGKACVQELDRRLRIDSRTIRHIIVRETRRQYKARLRQQMAPSSSEPVAEEWLAEEPEADVPEDADVSEQGVSGDIADEVEEGESEATDD